MRAQVDRGVEELLDEGAQSVGFGQAWDLVAELEVVEDLLDVGRESIEVGAKIRLQLLATGASFEVAQGERRSVVERLCGRLTERGILMHDACLVERGLHVKDRLLGEL